MAPPFWVGTGVAVLTTLFVSLAVSSLGSGSTRSPVALAVFVWSPAARSAGTV